MTRGGDLWTYIYTHLAAWRQRCGYTYTRLVDGINICAWNIMSRAFPVSSILLRNCCSAGRNYAPAGVRQSGSTLKSSLLDDARRELDAIKAR